MTSHHESLEREDETVAGSRDEQPAGGNVAPVGAAYAAVA